MNRTKLSPTEIVAITAMVFTLAVAAVVSIEYTQLTSVNRQVGAIYGNTCADVDAELGVVTSIANASGQLPDGTRLGPDTAIQTRSACSPQ